MTREMESIGILPMGPQADRILVHNLRLLEQHLIRRSNPVGGQDSIQAGAGGQELTVTANASISTNPVNDARVLHRLKRTPTTIVWFRPLDRPDDRLLGVTEGGQGLNNGNQTAWDDKAVYVRSSRSGARFVFVIT